MKRSAAWLVLAVCAALAVFVLKDKPWWTLPAAAGFFVVAALLIAGAFLGMEWLGRSLRRVFPPAPLWERPREASALFDTALVAPLQERLDLVEAHERASLWRDRLSGQYWSSFALDHEFGENLLFKPLSSREDWSRGPRNPKR